MKSIFKSMSCLVLGAIVTPNVAQQKKLYPELEIPYLLLLSQKIKMARKN